MKSRILNYPNFFAAIAILAFPALSQGEMKSPNIAVIVAFDDIAPPGTAAGSRPHFQNREIIDFAKAIEASSWDTHAILSNQGAKNENEFIAKGFRSVEWPNQDNVPIGLNYEIRSGRDTVDALFRSLDRIVADSSDGAPRKLLLYFSSHGTRSEVRPISNGGHEFGSMTMGEPEQLRLEQKFAILKSRNVRILFIDNSCFSGATTLSDLRKHACVLSAQNSKSFGFGYDVGKLGESYSRLVKAKKTSVVDLYEDLIRQQGKKISFSLEKRARSEIIPQLPMISGVNLSDADQAYWLLTRKLSAFDGPDPTNSLIDEDPDQFEDQVPSAFSALRRIEISLGKGDAYHNFLKKPTEPTRILDHRKYHLNYRRDVNKLEGMERSTEKDFGKEVAVSMSRVLESEILEPFLALIPSVRANEAQKFELLRALFSSVGIDYRRKNSAENEAYIEKGTGFESSEAMAPDTDDFERNLGYRIDAYLAPDRAPELSLVKAFLKITRIKQSYEATKRTPLHGALADFTVFVNRYPVFARLRDYRARLTEYSSEAMIRYVMRPKRNFETFTKKDREFLGDIMTFSLRRVREMERAVQADSHSPQPILRDFPFQNCLNFEIGE